MVHYTSEMLSNSSWWENYRLSDRTLDADGVSYQAYYSEVGKAHYTSTQSFGSAGKSFILRYADDFICAFRYRDEARRFYQELPKRLGQFHLSVAAEKTGLIRFSRFHPGMQRLIVFLGFETCWMKDANGVARVEQRTARKKLQGVSRLGLFIAVPGFND